MNKAIDYRTAAPVFPNLNPIPEQPKFEFYGPISECPACGTTREFKYNVIKDGSLIHGPTPGRVCDRSKCLKPRHLHQVCVTCNYSWICGFKVDKNLKGPVPSLVLESSTSIVLDAPKLTWWQKLLIFLGLYK